VVSLDTRQKKKAEGLKRRSPNQAVRHRSGGKAARTGQLREPLSRYDFRIHEIRLRRNQRGDNEQYSC